MTRGYVSVYEIIERVFTSPLAKEIDLSTIVRLTADGLLLIGAPTLQEDKEFEVEIIQYRAKLPCEIKRIKTVRKNGKALRMSANSFKNLIDHNNRDYFASNEKTYSINGEYIHTNFENDTIYISATVMPIDDNGYPVIPNNIKIKEFLYYHILARIAENMMLAGTMDMGRLGYLQQQRAFYAGAATNAAIIPSADEMETIKNMMVRLIKEPLAQSKFYDSVGHQEKRYPN